MANPRSYRNVDSRTPNNRTTIEHVSNTAVITTNVTVIYLFNFTTGMRIVDVCCGTGVSEKHVAPIFHVKDFYPEDGGVYSRRNGGT